jgi:hypothetical protein
MPYIKISKKEYLEMLWKTRDEILGMIGMFQKSDPNIKVFHDLLVIVNTRIKEVEDEVSKITSVD